MLNELKLHTEIERENRILFQKCKKIIERPVEIKSVEHSKSLNRSMSNLKVRQGELKRKIHEDNIRLLKRI